VSMSDNERLAPYLLPGEALIWTGRPSRGFRLRDEDRLPVGTVALCAVILIIAYASRPILSLFDLILSIFLAAAALSLLLKFLVDMLMRRSSVYGLSERRALMLTEWPRRTLRHVPLVRVSHLAITDIGPKRQTILLGVPIPPPDWRSGYWWPGMELFRAPSFELIEDGWRTYSLLRDLVDGGSREIGRPAA